MSVSTLTDALPAGFTYVTGSTTGATTANPGIVGQNLTWGPLSVPASGTASIHFSVHVSTTPGTYTNNVTGTAADGYTVTPSGAVAPITVTPVAVNHAITGDGTLRPASGGNLTTFRFSVTKTGTVVSGSATVISPKGTFTSTSATTLTVSGHVGTATLNGTWKGLPGYVLTIKATDGSPDVLTLRVKKGSTKTFAVNNELTSGSLTVS